MPLCRQTRQMASIQTFPHRRVDTRVVGPTRVVGRELEPSRTRARFFPGQRDLAARLSLLARAWNLCAVRSRVLSPSSARTSVACPPHRSPHLHSLWSEISFRFWSDPMAASRVGGRQVQSLSHVWIARLQTRRAAGNRRWSSACYFGILLSVIMYQDVADDAATRQAKRLCAEVPTSRWATWRTLRALPRPVLPTHPLDPSERSPPSGRRRTVPTLPSAELECRIHLGKKTCKCLTSRGTARVAGQGTPLFIALVAFECSN